MENFDYEQMEMPTPCEHCGEIFDLNDGYGSEKWHKDVVICKKCYREEEAEIEEDERWEGINIDVSNALYELKEEGAWAKLTDENRALIIQLVSGSLSKENDCNQRLNDGRYYLMGVEPNDLTVEDALEAFGFGRNGLGNDR